MSVFIDVIMPVFFVILVGYLSIKSGITSDGHVDGVMGFAQKIAVPCLVFQSISKMDLSTAYDMKMMVSFYAGSFISFALGYFAAIIVFKRPATEAVSIGFAAAFSNTFLLGIPIMERAYGPDSLEGNYAIISIHTPILYSLGITFMEWTIARSSANSISSVVLMRKIGKAVVTQGITLGILLGFAINLSSITLPTVFWDSVNLIGKASIPTALFGLGGSLCRYSFSGNKAIIAMVCMISLLIHPGVTWFLGAEVFNLQTANLRSAVVTASMAAGLTCYFFANLYGVAREISAASVLVSTMSSILTIPFWIYVLP